MERRELLGWIGGWAVSGSAVAQASSSGVERPVLMAQATPTAPQHDHAAMMAGSAAPRRFDALIAPYQECTRAAEVCISHCQQLLAQGDKALGDCLRTALDTEVVCSAVLKLAGLNSNFTAALAKQSVAVMQACVDACK